MNLPLSFVQYTQPILGSEWDAFEQALSQPSPVSIRLNPVKSERKKFQIDGINPVPWSKLGYYLPKRPSFTFDPLFHAGVYYVQEASSMFLEQVFRQYVNGSVSVLDLCAAPGGKSTHIASLIDSESLLVSNEVIASRANILLDNMIKSGFDNVIVTNNDPSAFGKLSAVFDVVVVDAPCSGEGMFRKDPEAIAEWSEANVQLCSERQQRIVADVWPALKEGGLFVYSTCTYNLQEDEENVRWIMENLGAEVVHLQVEADWKISSSLSSDHLDVYRFLPHKTVGEGFFMAVLRKTSADESINKKSREKQRKTNSVSSDMKNLLLCPERYVFQEINGKWRAYSPAVASFLEKAERLKILNAGVLLGEHKGKDLVVSHSLAYSNNLNKNHFHIENVDRKTAIDFLRKESFVIENAPKGYVLLAFEDSPIGFVKNLGNRVNSLLPNEWRIRSNHLPEENEVWLK